MEVVDPCFEESRNVWCHTIALIPFKILTPLVVYANYPQGSQLEIWFLMELLWKTKPVKCKLKLVSSKQ